MSTAELVARQALKKTGRLKGARYRLNLEKEIKGSKPIDPTAPSSSPLSLP